MSSTIAFRYRLRVRYGECDAQKVVFNVRYGDYVDLAVCEFVRAVGLSDLMVHGPLDYQLVQQTIEWKAPAGFDQVLELSVTARHLGNTSFTLWVEVRLAGQEPLVATAETVYVLMDAVSLGKTAIPDRVREALQAGAAGIVVDHADSSPR